MLVGTLVEHTIWPGNGVTTGRERGNLQDLVSRRVCPVSLPAHWSPPGKRPDWCRPVTRMAGIGRGLPDLPLWNDGLPELTLLGLDRCRLPVGQLDWRPVLVR